MSFSRKWAAFSFIVAAAVPALLSAQQAKPKPAMDKMESMDHAMMAVTKGSLSGAGDYQAAGTYEIVDTDGKLVLTTSADFVVDRRAPDIYVVLSDGAKVGKEKAVWLGKIKGHNGAQKFAIPAGTKLDGLTTVVLWCKKFSITIGTASLDAAALMKGAMMKDGG